MVVDSDPPTRHYLTHHVDFARYESRLAKALPLSGAFCFLQFIEPWHLPGLFRFRLRHTRSSKPGVLLELIYFEARHIGGPFLFLEPGNDRSSKT